MAPPGTGNFISAAPTRQVATAPRVQSDSVLRGLFADLISYVE